MYFKLGMILRTIGKICEHNKQNFRNCFKSITQVYERIDLNRNIVYLVYSHDESTCFHNRPLVINGHI